MLLGWPGLGAGLQGGEPERVAVLDFVRAESPGSSEPALVDFSRAVQARLLPDDKWTWVERQEFDLIAREADPGGASGMDPASAVRLGRLLRADLVLRGEIVQCPGGAGELRLEVIDLKSAELLASRTAVVTVNSRQKLHPTAAEVAAGSEAARGALAEAREHLVQSRDLRVLAPLYFKNTGKSSRLDYLEVRLTEALGKAAVPAEGFRALRFPRAGESGEEASLVLTGLTDTDPDAWQKVADTYVWGTFQEEPAEGAVFDEVPVTITLQVWNGRGDPQELKWQGPVRTLAEAETALASQVLAAAKAGAAGPAEGAARQRIAAGLRQRSVEVGQQIGSGGRDFLGAPAGRALFAYGLKLMEAACFFDPLNRELQEERLLMTWSQYNPFKPLETLRGWWLQAADYRLQAQRFVRRPDGQLDGEWPARRAKNLRAFIDLLEMAPWTMGKEVSQEEIHRQRQAVVAQWCAVLVDTQRAVAREQGVLVWYDARRAEWMKQAEFLQRNNDPIIVRDALEKILPVLEREFSRMLTADTGADQAEANDWIRLLFSTYGAFGDHSRPTALLDDLWRKYVPAQNGGSGSGSSDVVRPPPPPRSDRAWAPRGDARPSTGPATPAGQPASAIPVLATGVREIDPRFINTYQMHRAESTELFQKEKHARINGLAWHAGKLWISETDPMPLPPALGPVNRQGGHYVWSYDPVLRSAELVTTRLGGHSAVRFIFPTPDELWLGLEADGLWRWNAADQSVRKYRGEDGLQSLRLHAATQRPGELLFVNGVMPDLFVSRLSLEDGQWTGLQVPIPPSLAARMSPGQMAGLVGSPHVAVSGEWLCFTSPWVTFYNFTTKQWITNPLDPTGKSVLGGEFVTADASGFWMASGNMDGGGVVFFNLETSKPGEPLRYIRLPGRPTGMAHHGPWLWVVLGGRQGKAGLVLIDKRAFAVVGQVTGLPGEDFRHLAVSDDRIWLGGAMPPAGTSRGNGDGVMLMEVTLAEPRPAGVDPIGGQPTDFPLHRAVAAGDLDRLGKALTGKPAVDAAAASGWTALMAAADASRPDMVARLLGAGANPNLLSRDGDSALQRAALRGNEETVRLLLERGAQPNLRPPGRLRGLQTVTQPIELAAGEISPSPRHPANLRAAVTPDGEVVLDWEDKAGDEAFYDVLYKNSYGMRMVVARLPANTVRWVDPSVRDEAELVYAVQAVGKGDAPFPELPEVRITRPVPSPNIFRSRQGLGRNFGSEVLPASLLAQPPLATAAAAGHEGVVRLLLEKKADPNQEDAVGATPLIHAVRNRQYATARLLLAAGARPEASAGTGATAAGLAYQWHENAAFFEELLMAIPAPERRKEATQLIIQAATLGQIKDIEKLQALGGDLGAHVILGEPPLAAAFRRDQVETALWMLEKQASVFGPRWASGRLQEADERIIMAALHNNRPEAFARLLDLGLKVDQPVEEKPMATIAAKNKSLAVLRLLHQRGANLSLRSNTIDMDSRGDGSPASYLTTEEAKRYLGVAPPGPAKTWTPPTSISIMRAGPPQFVPVEDPAIIAPNRQLLEACKQGDLSAAMAAMAAGADTESSNQDGQTPLLLAIRAKAFDLVRWLVEEGASVNRTSKGGSSPVVFAVETGRWDVVDYLLQAGADINLAGMDGFPPLVYASATGNLPAMQRLLDAGADPNLSARRNGRIESPLARALWSGKVESVSLLLSRGANPKAQTCQYVDATSVGEGIKKQLGPSLLMFAAAGKNLALV
ncbi:MAG: ankyrin repeat domain-containing protein, partial [Opitutae bacterium]|nr:ankyrin repeat domain-containing protein [Opitutae bacterium]